MTMPTSTSRLTETIPGHSVSSVAFAFGVFCDLDLVRGFPIGRVPLPPVADVGPAAIGGIGAYPSHVAVTAGYEA